MRKGVEHGKENVHWQQTVGEVGLAALVVVLHGQDARLLVDNDIDALGRLEAEDTVEDLGPDFLGFLVVV